MKKLITYTTICLIAILLMPSCKSKMGITKRHYSKGYYVSHTKSKNKTHTEKVQPKQVVTDKIASVNILSSKPKEAAIKDQVNVQPKESIMASAFPKKGGGTYSENKTSYKGITINQQAKELKQAISRSSSGTHEGGGLSLFWIIILVILILWLLGFLAGGLGLGGLINILLIIALILLILWLLRIV